MRADGGASLEVTRGRRTRSGGRTVCRFASGRAGLRHTPHTGRSRPVSISSHGRDGESAARRSRVRTPRGLQLGGREPGAKGRRTRCGARVRVSASDSEAGFGLCRSLTEIVPLPGLGFQMMTPRYSSRNSTSRTDAGAHARGRPVRGLGAIAPSAFNVSAIRRCPAPSARISKIRRTTAASAALISRTTCDRWPSGVEHVDVVVPEHPAARDMASLGLARHRVDRCVAAPSRARARPRTRASKHHLIDRGSERPLAILEIEKHADAGLTSCLSAYAVSIASRPSRDSSDMISTWNGARGSARSSAAGNPGRLANSAPLMPSST